MPSCECHAKATFWQAMSQGKPNCGLELPRSGKNCHSDSHLVRETTFRFKQRNYRVAGLWKSMTCFGTAMELLVLMPKR